MMANWFDERLLKDGFSGLIGWVQNYDASGVQLEADLIQSDSGSVFTDYHPLLSIDNLLSCSPDFERVANDDAQAAEMFNSWLRKGVESGIVNAVANWFTAKAGVNTAKNLLEHEQMFDETGSISDLDPDSGNFVGMEIELNRSRSLVAHITEIGLRFNKAHQRTILLRSSDKSDPVESLVCEYQTPFEREWFSVDWKLRGSRVHYVGYDQGEADAQSVNDVRNYTWSDRGLTAFPSGRYLIASAFQVDSDGSSIWDAKENKYTVSTNYGLNIRYSVKCDFTDFVLSNKAHFQRLIGLSVARHFLRIMAYNTEARENRYSKGANRKEILYELDGDSQGYKKSGINYEYQKELDALSINIREGVDKVCLPCLQRGVNFIQ